MLKEDSITNFYWRIVGNGPDYESNKHLAESLGVSDLVEFVGEKKDNPYPYIKESKIFCFNVCIRRLSYGSVRVINARNTSINN